MGRDKAHDSGSDDLTYTGGKMRLFVEGPLREGAEIVPDEGQAHYLLHVMRAREGQRVLLFNGRDGEWQARIARIARRSCVMTCETRTRLQDAVPDLWFAFAPIKKTPADYVAQKATELGVRVLQPVFTHRTIAHRVNIDRLRANAVEAAEQSGRLSVPEICEPVELDGLLRSWPAGRRLLFCDEGGDAAPVAEALQQASPNHSWGVLTGPEGGFDDPERAAIRNCPFVLAVSLGPRIMRADTAALAALAVWQAIRGDWGQPGPGL